MDAIADPLPTRLPHLDYCYRWADRLLDVFGDKPKHKHFRLVKSSGSTAHPIIDLNRKVCALYGSMPNDEGFMADVHDTADHALEEARAMASLSYERLHHRRENFAQISGRDSHDGGQPYPGALVTPTYPLLRGNAGTPPSTRQGGLFRWVEHRFQMEEDFFVTLTDAQVKQEEQWGLKWAAAEATLFLTLEEPKAGA
ncbi:hypothetical protein K438DRAFT_1777384 [Mycena galopus ATCC 62051]|nr:hypothetical protein K438DRAFT_1777384 [Mycena galopus ATCC 62051]